MARRAPVMPALLGKLGRDVLAVNPYVSTAGRVSFDEEEASAACRRPRAGVGRPPGAIIDATASGSASSTTAAG
jgi:hypothetical protein